MLIIKTYHSDLISHTSGRHFLHHHCHHPLLLSSTPGSKLIFSTNPLLHSFSTFPPTGLTPWTPAVFCFHRACPIHQTWPGHERSSQHCTFVSEFGYLAAFSNVGGSKLSDVLNDAKFRTF